MFSADLQSVLSCVLLATLLAAIRHDLLEHRIPNVVCAVALSSACVIHTLASGVGGLAFALAGAAVGLIFFLPFYLLRGMGAGDVKLMCAVGSFLGPVATFFAAAVALVFGSAIGATLVIMTLVRRMRASGATLAAAPDQQAFPYAVAIAAGAILLMWHQGRFAFLSAMLGSE
jgi:prepilin peptidase CpaA